MAQEIESMRRLAKPFLATESFEQVIPDWKQALLNFKSQPFQGAFTWSLREEQPIQTTVSRGHYESGARRGTLTVFGSICCAWEIRAERRQTRRNSPLDSFILSGLASTRIQIWSLADDEKTEVARWTIEIGDQSSPGCHFHTQIDLDEEDNKFPKALSVPRLPSFLHTPMDALDFLLGELFQEQWYRHTSKGNDFVKNWNGCQAPRLAKVLGWHQEKIKTASGSPWTTFKNEKPQIDLLFD